MSRFSKFFQRAGHYLGLDIDKDRSDFTAYSLQLTSHCPLLTAYLTATTESMFSHQNPSPTGLTTCYKDGDVDCLDFTSYSLLRNLRTAYYKDGDVDCLDFVKWAAGTAWGKAPKLDVQQVVTTSTYYK